MLDGRAAFYHNANMADQFKAQMTSPESQRLFRHVKQRLAMGFRRLATVLDHGSLSAGAVANHQGELDWRELDGWSQRGPLQLHKVSSPSVIPGTVSREAGNRKKSVRNSVRFRHPTVDFVAWADGGSALSSPRRIDVSADDLMRGAGGWERHGSSTLSPAKVHQVGRLAPAIENPSSSVSGASKQSVPNSGNWNGQRRKLTPSYLLTKPLPELPADDGRPSSPEDSDDYGTVTTFRNLRRDSLSLLARKKHDMPQISSFTSSEQVFQEPRTQGRGALLSETVNEDSNSVAKNPGRSQRPLSLPYVPFRPFLLEKVNAQSPCASTNLSTKSRPRLRRPAGFTIRPCSTPTRCQSLIPRSNMSYEGLLGATPAPENVIRSSVSTCLPLQLPHDVQVAPGHYHPSNDVTGLAASRAASTDANPSVAIHNEICPDLSLFEPWIETFQRHRATSNSCSGHFSRIASHSSCRVSGARCGRLTTNTSLHEHEVQQAPKAWRANKVPQVPAPPAESTQRSLLEARASYFLSLSTQRPLQTLPPTLRPGRPDAYASLVHLNEDEWCFATKCHPRTSSGNSCPPHPSRNMSAAFPPDLGNDHAVCHRSTIPDMPAVEVPIPAHGILNPRPESNRPSNRSWVYALKASVESCVSLVRRRCRRRTKSRGEAKSW